MKLDTLKVNRTIDDKDGMLDGMTDYYFATGKSAMECINKAMSAAGKPHNSVTRVLDYACGYGRVLRWLMAAYPDAAVLGFDVDESAVASTQKTLGADTHVLDPKLPSPLTNRVDLIWIGSLLTHLDEAEATRVLAYLCNHLLPGGLLVCTTHGSLVERRLRTRERNYGLNEARITESINSYDLTGYGFSSYEVSPGYGISLVRPGKMIEVFEKAGLETVFYEAVGWVKHQDVFGLVRRV